MNELREDARSLIRAAVAEERPVNDARRKALKRALLSQAALLGAGEAAAAPDSLLLESGRALGEGGALGAGTLGALFAKGAAVGILVAGALHGVARFERAGLPPKPPPRVMSTEAQPSQPAQSIASTAPVVTSHTATRPLVASTSPRVAASEAAVASGTPLRAGAPTAVTLSLRAELELMAAVQAALRDGHSLRALELVDRHARLYPQGQLLQERLLSEALASCQSGDVARGRRAAEAFLARAPSSAMAERVRSACALNDDLRR